MSPTPKRAERVSLRKFARLWGFLGFVVLVLFLFRRVVLPFFFAILLAFVLQPLVARLSEPKRTLRLPRPAAILLCYSIGLSLLAFFFAALLPRLGADIARIGRETPRLIQRFNQEWAPQIAHTVRQVLPAADSPHLEPALLHAHTDADADANPQAKLPPPQLTIVPLQDGQGFAVRLSEDGIQLQPTPDGGMRIAPPNQKAPTLKLEDRIRAMAKVAAGHWQSQLGQVLRFGRSVAKKAATTVAQFFLVLMLAGFMLLDMSKVHAFVRGLVPIGYRGEYAEIATGIERGLAGVIRGQLLICGINGVLTLIGLQIFGIRYSILLALVAATMSLVPIFGTMISTLPIVAIALVSKDGGLDIVRAGMIFLWILAIHFAEGNFLNPKIVGATAKMHPVLIVFALVAGEYAWGLVGALLAVPVASMIQFLFVYFRSKAWQEA